LGSKSDTLRNVQTRVSIFVVPNFISFYIKAYDFSKVVDLIRKNVKSSKLVIRSSAEDEDTNSSSSAGEYDSVLNIPLDSPEEIRKGVQTVISSYKKKRQILPNDEVMVQEMVQNINMSGVVFTHDLNTGAPYYVINYDDESGLTDTVTSGNGEYSNRTIFIHRNSINKLRSERFIKLLQAVQDLEQVMNSQFLDIEFALGKDLTPYLLQVRAITTQPNWDRSITNAIDTTLHGVQLFVKNKFERYRKIYGEVTVFGQMPDWNPIEMIGRAPRALASSLYQTLITDSAWSKARSIMGYMTSTGEPLMVMLSGQPFIDTRLSFNSYLPKNTNPLIAKKLVNHWIGRLKDNPELHDKVEFGIAITTYSFDIDKKINNLIGDALSATEKDEFRRLHVQHTKKLIGGNGNGSINCALSKVDSLSKKYSKVDFVAQKDIFNLYSMVDDCIQLGTIPFSILARHGFIAKTILLSFEQESILTSAEINEIQSGVHTVASELVDDMHSLHLGRISNSDFMGKYGHLRPGTYDIKSHRYDQMSSISTGCIPNHQEENVKQFELSDVQRKKINQLLEKDGFDTINADDLLKYIHDAIIGREYGKFVFTRILSNILELIANFAEDNGLSRDEISHVPLASLLKVLKESDEKSIEDQLRCIYVQEENKHNISASIRLPQVLTDEAGVHIVPFQVSHPNFITHKEVTAPFVFLDSRTDGVLIKEKIVVIEGADPGFDWIFSQKISGLITKYGGANSHMAIRCAEFGVPAAIGCGEQRFNSLTKANRVHLDCAAGIVSPLY